MARPRMIQIPLMRLERKAPSCAPIRTPMAKANRPPNAVVKGTVAYEPLSCQAMIARINGKSPLQRGLESLKGEREQDVDDASSDT